MEKRCLVVDDSAFMRKMWLDILKKHGYDMVIEASNGIEAVEAYKKYKPDLVTMDITMPNMDGVSAVKEIIKIDSLAKIIVCSAMGQQQSVIEAMKNGAKTFIVKPFYEDEVLQRIRKVELWAALESGV